MSTLYPFAVVTASRPEEAKAAHQGLVLDVAVAVAVAIFDQLAFLTDSTYARRSAAYARMLCNLIAHVPQSSLPDAQSELIGAADELLSIRSASAPPVPFELVCSAGFHLALPGAISIAEFDKRFGWARTQKGVAAADQVVEWIEIVAQRAECRLAWIKAGRPDDRDPRILKDTAGPEESFIEDYMKSLPRNWKEETRIDRAEALLTYMRAGQRQLRARKIRWDRAQESK